MNDPAADLTRNDILPFWNAAVYATCLWFLGVAPLKSLVVAILVLVCIPLHYGTRWLMRGGVALLALSAMIWIGALAPPDHWHDMAAQAMTWSAQTFAAAGR